MGLQHVNQGGEEMSPERLWGWIRQGLGCHGEGLHFILSVIRNLDDFKQMKNVIQFTF